VAQKFHFAVLRIEVTRASCGLPAIAELLVCHNFGKCRPILTPPPPKKFIHCYVKLIFALIFMTLTDICG